MFIKYEFFADPVLVYIPDSEPWEIRMKSVDENGFEDCGLYLTASGAETQLTDSDIWCQGRPDLPRWAVGELYEEIIEVIAQKIIEESNLKVIDIPQIECRLLCEKYEKIWAERGYIEIAENGSW